MDTDEALQFLSSHQPMPDDDRDLSEELIRQYDDAQRHFTTERDRRSVPLLLNSFGQGSGFGVYQLVEDALRNQDRREILKALPSAIRSHHPGVRYWALQLADEYPDRTIAEAAMDVWGELNADGRFWAAKALSSSFDSDQDVAFVTRALEVEQDKDVREVLVDLDRD